MLRTITALALTCAATAALGAAPADMTAPGSFFMAQVAVPGALSGALSGARPGAFPATRSAENPHRHLAPDTDAATVSESVSWLPPPPPESALLVPNPESVAFAIVRGASFGGLAGGMALTVWGLGGAAGVVAQGGDQAALHRYLALAITGTVVAAISSTLSGLAGGR